MAGIYFVVCDFILMHLHHFITLCCSDRADTVTRLPQSQGKNIYYNTKEAFKRLSLDEYRKEMEGIYTSCADCTTLDEAPMAYKGIDEIISHIGTTVDIVERITPVYNFKAAE